jgi:Tfp pilus assembly protein PilO
MNTPTQNLDLTQTVPKEALAKLLPRLQDEKVRSFTTIAFTLTASVIFGLFAINPTLTTITELSKQLDDNKFVENQLQTKIAALTSLQKQYNTLGSDLNYATTSIPTTATAPFFLGQLQAVGIDSNVTLTRVQAFPFDINNVTTAPTKYMSFAFSVDGTGNQTNVNNYINNLDNLNRLVTIDSISISKASVTDNLVRFSIKGKAYFKTL